MPLMHEQIDDFVALTLHKFKKRKWVDISLPLQKYYFGSRFGRGRKFKEPKTKSVRKDQATGDEYSWRVQVDNTGTFRNSELYGQETVNVTDIMKEAKVAYSKQIVSMTWDVDEELFQSGPETIVSVMKTRTHAMMNDWYIGMENEMWTAPTDSAESPRSPFGIPWWIQQSTTAAVGLNGLNPSGFSSGRAGLSSSTYSNWANHTFTYNKVDDDDALESMAKSFEDCDFFAPDDFSELGRGEPDYEVYTVWNVLNKAQKLAKAQNDDIGTDLGRYRGTTMFRGVPFRRVRAFEDTSLDSSDTNDPIYGIDWNNMCWIYNSGRDMQMTKPLTPTDQPTVRKKYMYNWGQFVAHSLRSHFVGRKA